MKPLHDEIAAATDKTDHNRDWEAVPSSSSSAKRSVPSSEMVIHEVRSGETLSGLAVKYLGSSARYPEILEANRDRVKSPKDLRAGMKIRIPPRTADRGIAVRDRAALEPISRAKPESRQPRGAVDASANVPTARRDDVPVRGITSSPLDDEFPMEPDEQAFGESRGATLSSGIEVFGENENTGSAATSSPAPSVSEGDAKNSSRLFQAARRNPFLPGNEPANPTAAPEREVSETARGPFPEPAAKPSPPPALASTAKHDSSATAPTCATSR